MQKELAAIASDAPQSPLVTNTAAASGKKDVPIVFCADANYGLYLPVVVQSIIENSSQNHHYHIIIFDCGIAKDALDALVSQIRQYDNFSLRVENIESRLDTHKETFAEKGYLSRAMYGRLFIPEICRGFYKVIYTDIDVVFNRDIAELMDIDLGDTYIAAVIDSITECERIIDERKASYLEQELGLTADMPSIYSGLLVFQMKMWQEKDLADKIIHVLSEKKFTFPDQDAISSICKGKVTYLGQDWTCAVLKSLIEAYAQRIEKGKYPRLDALLENWRAAWRSDKAVIHYNGPAKPWNSLDIHKACLWWEYAARTPLYPRYIRDLARLSANGLLYFISLNNKLDLILELDNKLNRLAEQNRETQNKLDSVIEQNHFLYEKLSQKIKYAGFFGGIRQKWKRFRKKTAIAVTNA